MTSSVLLSLGSPWMEEATEGELRESEVSALRMEPVRPGLSILTQTIS